MKKIFALIYALAATAGLSAQTADPVKWSYTMQSRGGGEIELHIRADIQPGWKLYAPGEDKGGPLPTAVKFTEMRHAVLHDTLQEMGQRHTAFDKNFDMDVSYYNDKAVFIQRIKRRGKREAGITCTVEYMACDSMQCLPPDTISWRISLP